MICIIPLSGNFTRPLAAISLLYHGKYLYASMLVLYFLIFAGIPVCACIRIFTTSVGWNTVTATSAEVVPANILCGICLLSGDAVNTRMLY